MEKQYKSASSLAEMYDVSKEFFLRRKESGEFILNTHFVCRGNTIRWNLEEIEKWWFGETEPNKQLDDILSKVIPS